MKKILAAVSLTLLVASAATAQDMYYGEMLSANHYYGTARSMALGNAVSALGGDLGTIGINPAGSAVANYGQFTVTPGLTLSLVNSSYAPEGGAFANSENERKGKVTLPNIGVGLTMDTGSDWGLKGVSFAFTANTVNNFLRYSTATGFNSSTSMLGNFAAAAKGISDADLANPSAVNRDIYASYAAGQFNNFGPGLNYAGCNEALDALDTYHYLPGTILQTSHADTYGSKTDFVLNMGMNFDDRFFLGFNLGIPSVTYTRHDLFVESARDPEQFPIHFITDATKGTTTTTNYCSSTNDYKLVTDADGVYAKIGAIFLPTENLRIGAAVQTPTSMTIKERWLYTAATTFSDPKFSGSGRSPQGEYSYHLRTPYIVNCGVAYTFGSGFVSADYEMADYSVMKYSDLYADDFSEDFYYGTNQVMKKFCGIQSSLRVGAEYRLTDQFSARLGFTMTTSPERIWYDGSGNKVTADDYLDANGNPRPIVLDNSEYSSDHTRSFSIGFGYASYGSFFADAVVRLTQYPASTFLPYYYDDYAAVDKAGKPLGAKSPVVSIKNNLLNAALTIGWRF